MASELAKRGRCETSSFHGLVTGMICIAETTASASGVLNRVGLASCGLDQESAFTPVFWRMAERPCLKVMVARPTQENERKIPREIEGYPVVTDFRRNSPASSVRPFSGAVRNFELRMLLREARWTFSDRRRDT